MTTKTNKIHAAISPDLDTRTAMVKQIIVDLGFARTRSDAAKLLRDNPYDADYANAYFLFAANYNLRDSIITTQKLYEMAARGFAVVVGMKKLQPELEILCTAHFPEDFTRL